MVVASVIDGFLVIVSCGSEKIWRRHRDAGPTPARDAYTSSPFRTSRRYAEHFAERWLVLSAKYGFIDPDFTIAEDYNISFNGPGAMSATELQRQVVDKRLGDLKQVGVLGSAMYWRQVANAFDGSDAVLRHVNGNIGFAPLFQRLVGDLIANGTPFREDPDE
jgi:uncharacterized protein DUF6884